MGKSRVLSQSKAVYTTKTGVLYGSDTTIELSGVEATQLHRIDSFSWDVDIDGARQDIRVFGQQARIGTVNNGDLSPKCSFSYLLTDGENESHLGMEIKDSITGNFVAGVQCLSGFLTEHSDYKERNIFAVTVAEGVDAFSAASWTSQTNHDVVGFGNSFMSDYGLELSVGEIPKASTSFDCANIAFYTGISSGLYNPSINASTAAIADSGQVALPVPSTGDSFVDVLRDGQIQLDLQEGTDLSIGGPSLADIHPQSVSLSIPLGREALKELGQELPYSRPLTFPIKATLAVSALAADMKEGQSKGLLTGCAGDVNRNIVVKLKDRCDGSTVRFAYIVNNAVLDSVGNSQDLEGNETTDLQFSVEIGGATTITEGVHFSGSYLLANGSPVSPNYVSGLYA